MLQDWWIRVLELQRGTQGELEHDLGVVGPGYLESEWILISPDIFLIVPMEQ